QLDHAKKGPEKENQKAREAIRFLDDRLNRSTIAGAQPLLIAQNLREGFNKWSEVIQYIVEEDTQIQKKKRQTQSKRTENGNNGDSDDESSKKHNVKDIDTGTNSNVDNVNKIK